MRHYVKNKYLLEIISVFLLLTFCFSLTHCCVRTITNLKGNKTDTLSPSIKILKQPLVFEFSRQINLKKIELDIMAEFPGLKNEFNNIKKTSFRWEHTLEVVLYLDRLKNKDFDFFIQSIKFRKLKHHDIWDFDEAAYKERLEQLYALYNDLPAKDKEELNRAAKLHDVGFTETEIDYYHPEKGARKAEKLFPQNITKNILNLIKYHDLIGNIIRGKKVVSPLIQSGFDDKFIKMLVIINAMDIAGYGNIENGKFITRNNLTPTVLDDLLSYSGKEEILKRHKNNEFYLVRLRMLGRTKNGEIMSMDNMQKIQTAMMQGLKQDNILFKKFQENWTNNIEVDDVSLCYELAKLSELDSPYELLAKLFWGISDITTTVSEDQLPLVVFNDLTKSDLKDKNTPIALKDILKNPGFSGLSITPNSNRLYINLHNSVTILNSI